MLLGDVLKLLPLVIRNRYRDLDFWIPMANRILGEIEVISDQRSMLLYEPILIVSGVTRYRLPDRIRKFGFLRQPDFGTPLLDKWPVVQYDLAGRNVQTTWPVPMNGAADITGAVTAVANGITISADELAGVTDSMVSWLFLFTKADGSQYSGIVAANADGTVTIDGPALQDPEIDDTFILTPNFLMVEGFRYLERFSSELDDTQAVIGLSQEVPLPDEWQKLMLTGLRYYGELQTDENGVNVPNWYRAYEQAKFDYKADHRTPNGEMKRQRPASWPSIGS